MISVVIPTLNAQRSLAETMTSLVPAAVDGLVSEVIVADGGSTDRTFDIADGAGADIVKAPAGRGAQLRAGAERARFPWLLFLNADTYLDAGWERDASQHIERVESGRRQAGAATFRFVLDDEGLGVRMAERMAALRTGLLKIPYGNQGLLLPRTLYDEVGGISALPLLEDVDFARRLGRRRITVLNARAVTDGERYRRDRSFARAARAQACLGLYLAGVPVKAIAALFGPPHAPVGETVAERGAS
ncbi:MAG TPA: glycosyltransferase [Hyphomicrobium sp.]|nr:glycosyltransferase [Hyphomicrobium sp.]